MQRWLHLGEWLFASLDDVWLVSQPEEVHIVAEHELWTHATIQGEDSRLEPLREETSQL